MRQEQSRVDPGTTGAWQRLFFLVVASAWFLALMEWLFLVTKPSFMSQLTWIVKLRLLLIAPLLLFGLAFAVAVGLEVASRLASKFKLRIAPGVLSVGVAVAVFLMSAILLADNFTIAVLGFGIAGSQWLGKSVYVLLVTVGCFLLWRRSFRFVNRKAPPRVDRLRTVAAATLVVAALVATFLALLVGPRGAGGSRVRANLQNSDLPNVLLVAMDGIDAERLSLYGYERQTTPWLNLYLSDSLTFENALSNGQSTTASVFSMLSGKLPTTTRLIYGPHVFQGRHAVEHLPGLLRQLGYDSFQETLRYWGDTWDSNMLDSFDQANGRTAKLSWLSSLATRHFRNLGPELYFIRSTGSRVADRVLHLLSVRRMSGGFDVDDRTRIDRAIEFIERAERPFFGQIHLLETHCCTFRPTIRHFSARHPKEGIESREDWLNREYREDFFDDAVLSADAELGRLLQWLEEEGRLDDTLIVFSSDHSPGWRTDVRLPLLVRLPGGGQARRIDQPVQLLDVAPTVIDVLGQPIPAWMEGRSLLEHESFEPDRRILSVSKINDSNTSGSGLAADESWGPPHYGIVAVSLSVCGRSFHADIRESTLRRRVIKGWTLPCPPSAVPTEAEAIGEIGLHLQTRGFDAQ